MAQAKKCDRCGTLCDVYNTLNNETESNGFMFLNIDSQGDYWKHTALDLCPKCNEELHKWFENSGG